MAPLATLSRYWHTVRHLRPVQIYGRAWFRLARPAARLQPAPPLRPQRGGWQPPARRAASLTGPGEFLFLGVPGSLATVGWDGPERDKLWRYNQHYFDDLNAVGAEDRSAWHAALLEHWVRFNPPRPGNGWEPYPTSLRIVNWVKWALSGHQLPAACVQSLAVQTRWLAARLERHLLGNHLFANAKALVFSGLFFAGPEASAWLAKGLKILSRELPEQVLADGGHFERSTMYHALALEDMLDLCNVAAAYPQAEGLADGQLAAWRDYVARMRAWLDAMCHPDGDISFFNDTAFGIAPAVEELHGYADRISGVRAPQPGAPAAGPHACHLAETGYIRVVDGAAVALLDVGRVGPDYLPGHAHADTLSFELSLGSQRVFVNSGTSVYGTGPERLRQRGTAAHNTVVIADADSSEVWAGFRVARRALPFGLQIEQGPERVTVRCSHDGYRRLPGAPVHQRSWSFDGAGLVVEDTVIAGAHPAQARFHLHPEVQASLDPDAGGGTLRFPDGRQLRWSADAGEPTLQRSTWHPRFGASEPNTCIVLQLTGGRSRLRIDWQQA